MNHTPVSSLEGLKVGDKVVYRSKEFNSEREVNKRAHGKVVIVTEIWGVGRAGGGGIDFECNGEEGGDAYANEVYPLSAAEPNGEEPRPTIAPPPVPLTVEKIAAGLTPVGWADLLRLAGDEVLKAEGQRRLGIRIHERRLKDLQARFERTKGSFDREISRERAELERLRTGQPRTTAGLEEEYEIAPAPAKKPCRDDDFGFERDA